jgi:hypothetical protein
LGRLKEQKMRGAKLARLVVVALLASPLFACEADRALAVGALAVSPGALDFGAVDLGLSKQIRVSVTNPSASAVAVPAIKISNDPNHELGLSDLLSTDCEDLPRASSQALAPGECARFTVTWTPLEAHKAIGAVEIDPSDLTLAIELPVSGLGLSTLFPELRACALGPAGEVLDAGCTNLSVNPPVLPPVDFGNGRLSASTSRTVRVFNDGLATLHFTAQPSLPVTTPTAFALSGSVPGLALQPGGSVDLIVTATPSALGTLQGALELATDDPRQTVVELPLLLATTGISICVAPAVQLPFGLTLVGDKPEKHFALTNCGTDDVAVESDSFEPIAPTTTQFSVSADAPIRSGSILHPNDHLMSAVTYAPTVAESDLASLAVRFSNSFGVYTARVGLSGSAVNTFCGTPMEPTPTANIAASYSANQAGPYLPFDPNASPSPVVPLDWIRLDGSASTGANPGSYTWTLVSQPSGSQTTLMATGAFAGMQTLVSGNYLVKLAYSDANGCAGTSTITIHVVPTGDVHIELTWAESCGDVDLHYIGPGGTLCASTDTAYYNTNPDWGCATQHCGHEEDPGGIYPDGTRSDDATLDHDDQWGFGPENITQSKPFDSPAGVNYGIYVYYFSAVPDGGGGSGRCGTTHPTVNVYIGGELANTFSLPGGFSAFAAWHAADISVSNGGANIQVLAGESTAIAGGACTGNNHRSRSPAPMAKDLLQSK